MPRKQWRGSSRSVVNTRAHGRAARATKGPSLLEQLECRQMLAAHIIGDPTVYATIQAAVDAATAGAVINIYAGSYSEQVSINKHLPLRGAQAGIDARSNLRQSG